MLLVKVKFTVVDGVGPVTVPTYIIICWVELPEDAFIIISHSTPVWATVDKVFNQPLTVPTSKVKVLPTMGVLVKVIVTDVERPLAVMGP